MYLSHKLELNVFPGFQFIPVQSGGEIVCWVTTEVSDDFWQLLIESRFWSKKKANCSEEEVRTKPGTGGSS